MKPENSCAALLTDFGLHDWFVAALHGEILSRAPQASIIDITHAVPPQAVEPAAVALEAALESLPARTIICAVVNPGVGTNRRAMCGWIGDYGWSGPDNGLATPLLQIAGHHTKLYNIEHQPWRKPETSNTFHGRDIFAPAAAQLLLGCDPSSAGLPIYDPVRLPPDAPKEIAPGEWQARVVWVDRFGNCLTNILESEFAVLFASSTILIHIGNIEITKLAASYAAMPPGLPLAYWGSAGRLEIGINRGSAAREGGANVSTPVLLRVLTAA